MLAAIILILAFASFAYAAFRSSVRWVAVGLALTIIEPAVHALASLL
jgi:hypothetical protein